MSAVEGRSTATWYSANNATRMVAQLQARGEWARATPVDGHNVFLATTVTDAAAGRAVGLTRTEARAKSTVSSLVVAPSVNIRQDLGRQGILSVGARADAWTVGSLTPGALRAMDVSPRLSFLRRLYPSTTASQPVATLRLGLGRFTDWPTVPQWSDAAVASAVAGTTCAGPSVPAINLADPNAVCAADATASRTALTADPQLRPVQSDRGDLSLAIARLPFKTRAEVGVSAARTTRVPVRESPHDGLVATNILTGDGGRQSYTPAGRIGADGSVPIFALPMGVDGSTRLRSDGGSQVTQLRARLTTRDPFARVRLDLSYAYTMGREQQWSVSDADGAPHGTSAPLSAGGRHTLAFAAGVWVSDVEVRFSGILRSGARFTPLADRDLNGDGRANDPVFLTTANTARFRAAVPSYLQSCVDAAVGHVAALNSCTGPWSLTSLVFATIPGVHLGLPLGSSVDLLLSNALGVLAHGGARRDLVFGRPTSSSPMLANVTGFSASSQTFQIDPLSGFGALPGVSPQLSEPVGFSIGVRAPLGRSVTTQRAAVAMAAVRSDSSARAQARAASQFFGDLPPLPVLVMQGGEDAQLTAAQRQALGGLMGRWQASMSRLFAEATTGARRDGPPAAVRLAKARAKFLAEAIQIAAEITQVLTADQIERLPEGIQRLLNPRFLRFLATQDAATG